jgi:hypothetical protein
MVSKPKPVSQWSESQTAEDMRAKWLDINNGLQGKETCRIMNAAFEHTRIMLFYKEKKLRIVECDKGDVGSCAIFDTN